MKSLHCFSFISLLTNLYTEIRVDLPWEWRQKCGHLNTFSFWTGIFMLSTFNFMFTFGQTFLFYFTSIFVVMERIVSKVSFITSFISKLSCSSDALEILTSVGLYTSRIQERPEVWQKTKLKISILWAQKNHNREKKIKVIIK